MSLPPKHPGATGTGDETPEQIAAIKQHEMTEEGQGNALAVAWREVMATMAGRRVIWDIIEGHLKATEPPLISSDIAAMVQDVMRHNIGLHLLEQMRREYPADYRLMMQENGR